MLANQPEESRGLHTDSVENLYKSPMVVGIHFFIRKEQGQHPDINRPVQAVQVLLLMENVKEAIKSGDALSIRKE